MRYYFGARCRVWRRLQEIKELFVNVSVMDNNENNNDNNGSIKNYDSINIIRQETERDIEEMDDEKALRYHKNIVECDTYLSVDFHCTVGFATWVWLRFLFELLTSDYAVAFDIVNIWIVLLTFILWFAACYCLWTSLHDIHSLCELVAYRAWQRKYLQKTKHTKKMCEVISPSWCINLPIVKSKCVIYISIKVSIYRKKPLICPKKYNCDCPTIIIFVS